ncbi:hypothetical protein [Nocardia asteroides]|uniref:hypothetical protein n=1 Tax=Nocardia asteroides TaxID=1824 RepID=UPI001E464BAD|nr:hypothetical protein [Nocardia asteroides]UGT63363.1 hypothetical protein LTT61_08650 [Nocardia asteroides]
MLGRLMMLAWLVPRRQQQRDGSGGKTGWWVGGAIVLALLAVPAMAILAAAGTAANSAADLRYQCDSAVGPDPSGGAAEPAPLTAATPSGRAATPSANPYAELTIPPDSGAMSAWERGCVAAMRTAPYQDKPWGHGNTGTAAGCARELALARLDAVADAGALVRAVTYGASLEPASGRCAEVPVEAGAGGGVCGRPETGGAVVLPESIAAQSGCGQRVHRSAVSAGDLVFWDFRGNAPARAGVAVGSGQLVTVEPGIGRAVWQQLPDAADVRVKRVLSGAA